MWVEIGCWIGSPVNGTPACGSAAVAVADIWCLAVNGDERNSTLEVMQEVVLLMYSRIESRRRSEVKWKP